MFQSFLDSADRNFLENRMIQSFLDSAEQLETGGSTWSHWEIRLLVLLSLLLQIVLILFGNRRKYSTSTWVGIVIWVAYLLSDSVALFSLGFISHIQSYSCPSADKSIQAAEAITVLWAPFLLVHLGGPDTITAYSMEDNELWLRHLYGFLVQVGLVFYLLVLSWIRGSLNNDTFPLTFIAIPVFVSGVLKYGEKTYVLLSSSSERFKRTSREPEMLSQEQDSSSAVIPEAKHLVTADWFLKILKCIYAKRSLSSEYRNCIFNFLLPKSDEDAFKVIEIELGFLYDTLFSKVSLAHSPAGLILRSISLVSSSAALLAFVIVVDKHKFSLGDIIITYVLAVGAICVEIYGIVMLIFSERTLLRLKKQKNCFGKLLYRSISASPSASMERKMWSGSMAQFNLIGFCIRDKPAQCAGIQKFLGIYSIQKFLGIYKSLEIGRYKTWEKVTTHLKNLIFENIKERSLSITMTRLDTELNSRGAYAIRKGQLKQDSFLKWSVERELHQSIFIWHIATDLCYFSDFNSSQNNSNPSPSLEASISKSLSDYMMYLVVFLPSMLPTGNWEIEYEETIRKAWDIICPKEHSELEILSRARACQLLLNVQIIPGYGEARRKGYNNPNVRLTDACWVAKLLLRLGHTNKRWEVMKGVWIEMLCYAANKCDWKYHVQQLSRGGELLTHVCLLMVHLGLTDKIEHEATFVGSWNPLTQSRQS